MKEELKDAKEQMRNAARASLLAMRSMVDARIRHIERKQAAAQDAGATRADEGEQRPHEIV